MSDHRLYLALTALRAGLDTLRREEGEDALIDHAPLPEEADVEEAIVAVMRKVQKNDLLADAAEAMAEGNRIRAARFKARAARMKGIALAAMDSIALKKIEVADMTISIKAGGQSVLITDEKAIPTEYLRDIPATTTPDKAKIAADLKEGVVIEGAALSNGMPSISYRTS